MKRFKVNIAMFALVLGAGFGLSTAANSRFHAPNYANSGTKQSPVWTVLTATMGSGSGQYACTASTNYCTAYFATPPSAHQIPTDYELGAFSINP